jgi:hypothetical protein
VAFGERPRVSPPAGLADKEKRLFQTIVAQCAPSHFVASDAPLIGAYVQAILLSRWAVKEGDLATWERASKVMATMATKLRLCPHSRTDPKTITRRSPGGIGISASDYLATLTDDTDD